MAQRKLKKMNSKKLLVLDTNVLMHDPTALVKFQEHDVFIPAIVLEELNDHKNDHEEIGRTSRQALRFIDELFIQIDGDADIEQGIPLSLLSSFVISDSVEMVAPTGLLYFQTKETEYTTGIFAKHSPDNDLLSVALELKKTKPNVVIVSNDINLRIKARTQKIPAEQYKNDQTIDDIQLLYSGTEALPADFSEILKTATSWKHDGQNFYDVVTPLTKQWRVNQFLYFENPEEKDEFIVLKTDGDKAQIRTIKNYREQDIFGIKARNREQNFALNALLDPDIDFVTLAGKAGSGKTLLALTVALHLILEKKQYDRMIFTREAASLGKEQGHLPGSEEAKLAPWLGALYDNIEILTEKWEKQKGHQATDDAQKKGKTGNPYIDGAVSIKSLNYMQGRSLVRKIFIVDETQNINAKQAKDLITRAGPGTKVIFLGNLAQAATPYLSATSSGLAYVVDRFKTCEFSAHVTLIGVERSRLAEFAANNL